MKKNVTTNENLKAKFRWDAFISYRRDSANDKADALHGGISGRGYSVTYDKVDQEPGDFWENLKRKIRLSRVLLVIISNKDCFDEKENDFFLKEISEALKQKKDIIPIYYDGVKYEDIKESLEKKQSSDYDIHSLATYQEAEFQNSNPEGSYDKICSLLRDTKREGEISDLKQRVIGIYKYLNYIICGLIVIIAFSIYFFYKIKELNRELTDSYICEMKKSIKTLTDPLVVFVGGGSVKEYLLKETDIDITKEEKSIYVNMPSGNAWNLLEEEAVKNKQDNNMIYICLSACQNKLDSSLLNKIDTKHLGFAEFEIGKDPLVVYMKKDLKDYVRNNITGDTIITKNGLIALLKKSNIAIFTTRINSGTLNEYKKILKKDSILVGYKNTYFFSGMPEEYIDSMIGEKPYIFLGSKYYGPNLNKKKDFLSLTITDENSIIAKSLYLYFLVYCENRDKQQNGIYIISKPIVNFLKKIRMKNSIFIGEDTWNQIDKDPQGLWYKSVKDDFIIVPNNNP